MGYIVGWIQNIISFIPTLLSYFFEQWSSLPFSSFHGNVFQEESNDLPASRISDMVSCMTDLCEDNSESIEYKNAFPLEYTPDNIFVVLRWKA